MTLKVASLPLPSHIKAALLEAKYDDALEVASISADDLSQELNLEKRDIEVLLKCVHSHENGTEAYGQNGSTRAAPPASSSTAAALLKAQKSSGFKTSCPALDELIARTWDGSKVTDTTIANEVESDDDEEGDKQPTVKEGCIFPGMTIEICGPPGGGKTALATAILMSALSVEPVGDHSVDDTEVLLIDTEGNYGSERLLDVLRQSRTHSEEDGPTLRSLLRRIHFMRIATQIQMMAFINVMDDWLAEHPKVKLTVIDSLSYHFRQPNMDSKVRNRVMETLKQQIAKATSVRGCAVIVTNQLATKLLTAENKPANFDTGDRAVLMPHLGDVWIGGKTVRMVLFRESITDSQRRAHATLANSVEGGAPWARFDIDSIGLPCNAGVA